MSLTFMDFCSGIGTGRLRLENAGFKCVAHSEIDPNPDLTYQLFFNDNGNLGDLTKLNPNDLPKLSGYEALLLQGFPKEIAKKVIEHKLPDSKTLSQAGNAMTVTVIGQLGRQLLKSIGK